VQPASAACSGNPTPAVCVNTNPGGGKSKNIADALNVKINGSTTASCSSPNYWTSPNKVGDILAQSLNGKPDPRLVELFYTDNVALPNGSTNVPIRGTSANGLSYVPDTVPPDNTGGVVMGHFVTYIRAFGTGSGSKCVQGTLSVCVPVLTK
jgi:hypothetical protein